MASYHDRYMNNLTAKQEKVCATERQVNLAVFRAHFDKYDANKNNILEKSEFRKLCAAQYDFTTQESNRLVKKFDADRNGGIDREEYAVRGRIRTLLYLPSKNERSCIWPLRRCFAALTFRTPVLGHHVSCPVNSMLPVLPVRCRADIHGKTVERRLQCSDAICE
eukprot:SAG22_NODE_561_length_9080_cov_2.242623_4_plen_165_part_00